MITPEEYEKRYYKKLFSAPPKFKVGDEVKIKTARGLAPGIIYEVVFRYERKYKVYVTDTYGYVWWNEKDIV